MGGDNYYLQMTLWNLATLYKMILISISAICQNIFNVSTHLYWMDIRDEQMRMFPQRRIHKLFAHPWTECAVADAHEDTPR